MTIKLLSFLFECSRPLIYLCSYFVLYFFISFIHSWGRDRGITESPSFRKWYCIDVYYTMQQWVNALQVLIASSQNILYKQYFRLFRARMHNLSMTFSCFGLTFSKNRTTRGVVIGRSLQERQLNLRKFKSSFPI